MTRCSPSLLRLQEVRVISCTFGSNHERVVVPGEIFSKHIILSSPLHLPTPTHFLFILPPPNCQLMVAVGAGAAWESLWGSCLIVWKLKTDLEQ